MDVPREDADGDAMRIGATNLTSTLYNTALAVYIGNSSSIDDDHEALKRRQNEGRRNATNAVDCSSACSRVEKKLLEGYVIKSEACKHCFLPLLEKDGVVICALPSCRGDLEPPLAVPSSTSSVSIDEEVDRQMIDYNNQRSEVTEVIASKIIEGYVLQEKSCGLCGMPLMKSREGLISCVLCPCPAKGPVQDKMKKKEASEIQYEKKVRARHLNQILSWRLMLIECNRKRMPRPLLRN